MKRTYQLSIILPMLLLLITSNVKASDWTYIASLEGQWQFSVGDDPDWAKPSTDVSGWDRIFVPAAWERYYEGYNGYGWYRKDFSIKSLPAEGPIALFLGCIDDVDEVFINGVKVGQTGSFFPHFKSAYNVERKYDIPRKLLKPTNNVIAVRVYDEGRDGGIVSGRRIGICYDNDNSLLSVNLSGKWKFSTYRQSNVNNENFDDSKWGTMDVPGTWESQGLPDHDGYGWYRKRFTIPTNLNSQKLYLVLGKIDDTDRVYFNGNQLGRTESRNYNIRTNADYRKNRIYEIPSRMLKAENVVVVEVNDYRGVGGIYEGPVGIMTEKDVEIYSDRLKKESHEFNSFWEFIDYAFD